MSELLKDGAYVTWEHLQIGAIFCGCDLGSKENRCV